MLIADDDENDLYCLRRAIQKAGLRCEVFEAADGQQVIDYLKGEAPYADRALYPVPDLLVLDLEMPRRNGLEVLEWLQGQPQFRGLPIAILSGTDQREYVAQARRLGAKDFLIKPSDFNSLVRLVRDLETKWLAAPARASTP